MNALPGEVVGTADASIHEMSGLAASQKNPGIIWTMEDSQSPTNVYALSESGSILMTVNLPVTMNDWEDIAIYVENGRHYIYISDTGNNYGPYNRDVLSVYRFEEPTIAFRKARTTLKIPKTDIETYTFNYGPGFSIPNVPDCEALAVDPDTGDMFFFTKDWSKTASEVYRYPAANQVPNSNYPLEKLTTLPILQVTGADITPEGHRLAIVNYGGVGYGLERPEGISWADFFRGQPSLCEFSVAPQVQREAVAATNGGYFITSECGDPDQGPQDIYFYAFN